MRDSSLREVISSTQADQIISHTTSAPTDWVSDNAKRRQAYTEIFKTGSLTSIATMIKELVVRGAETGLNQYDKDLLPKAQKKLLSEIALAKGIEFEGAINMMNRAILQRPE
jgi:RNA polymerase-interacting CarD/CdnL/TRCF family regulator